MDEPFEVGDPPDVVRIMKEIRESIQRKRERGVYTEEEVDDQFAVRVRAWATDAHIDPRLLERLLGPSHDWNVSADYPIRSHRGGLGATLIVGAKKLVAPLVRLYSDHVVNRQAQLNLYLAYLTHNLVRESVRLRIEVQALRKRCQELERDAGRRET
jgi:hypothetical protein